MVLDLILLASEHRRDLLLEADRRRLALGVKNAPSLRNRVGTRLVWLGWRISGERGGPTTNPNPFVRKEVGEWKPF